MDSVRQKSSAFLWLVIPLGFSVLYPLVKADAKTLEWPTMGTLIYVLFLSVIVHDLCHGLAAKYCGDHTAEEAERLTPNPLRHISVVGSLILPLVLYFMKAPAAIDWAKPVTFNPAKLRQYPRNQVFLAPARPLANFALAYI